MYRCHAGAVHLHLALEKPFAYDLRFLVVYPGRGMPEKRFFIIAYFQHTFAFDFTAGVCINQSGNIETARAVFAVQAVSTPFHRETN